MARVALQLKAPRSDPRFAAGLAAIAAELELPHAAFPAAALAEAQAPGAQPARGWQLIGAAEREDLRSLPLVTLDPASSLDLDQALAIERPGADGNWTLHYAIADVAAHVRPGGAIDAESWQRGETTYLPGDRRPLHPPQLSEGAASLLPGVDRLAVVWTHQIDGSGEVISTTVRRATVRSTAKLAYDSQERALGTGEAHEQVERLAELGPLLVAAAARRGAIDLPDRAQELELAEDGTWSLYWEPPSPLQRWNAELSLATGRAAADLMLQGGVGVLRTLPAPSAEAVAGVADAAGALGVSWDPALAFAEQLGALDPSDPASAALIDRARALLRGAGYLELGGTLEEGDSDESNPLVDGKTTAAKPAPEPFHAGVGAAYAHVTAPLRRLGDRYATESALAAATGVRVPDWVADALPGLPVALTTTARRGGAAARAALDLAEALILESRVGEQFDVAVVAASREGATVVLDDPPVQARCDGAGLRPGTRSAVTLAVADPVKRQVRFRAGDRPPDRDDGSYPARS